MDRKLVYEILDGERDYQDSRWNEHTTATGGRHTPTEFMVYMQDYLQEAMKKVSRTSDEEARGEALAALRKVTALGIACFEQHGVPPR